jgi:hypothetical protein
VAVEPEDASALHVLGNLLLDVHKDDNGAEKLLQKAMLISPADASITCDYGRLLQSQVQCERKAETFDADFPYETRACVALLFVAFFCSLVAGTCTEPPRVFAGKDL